MSRGVAARSIAMLLVSLPFVCGSATDAFAEYQMNVVAATDPAPPSSQAPAEAGPFGGSVVPVTGGEVLSKWVDVIADIRAESDILAQCRDDAAPCPAPAEKFLAVIAEGRAHEGRARIGLINRAINLAIRPVSDLAQWGIPDRWSTPLATLATGRGDCEDYAIAKYVALTAAGIAADDVRLVILHDLAAGEDHAIVAVRLDEKWIVLDNRRLALVEDVEMPRVLPLFVLDRNGAKQFAPTAIAQSLAQSRTAMPTESSVTPGALDF
jgi:predicted transglutaminase-like cysteine proteinase